MSHCQILAPFSIPTYIAVKYLHVGNTVQLEIFAVHRICSEPDDRILELGTSSNDHNGKHNFSSIQNFRVKINPLKQHTFFECKSIRYMKKILILLYTVPLSRKLTNVCKWLASLTISHASAKHGCERAHASNTLPTCESKPKSAKLKILTSTRKRTCKYSQLY